jgi:redox-sensitive bicupin YhaK (pirin superfamily)
MHGIQAWVALPERDEETAPEFFHHGEADLPAFGDAGARGRLIAGEAFGLKARVETRSPMFYVHWELAAGARAEIPSGYAERAVYVASGSIEADGRKLGAGEMAIFAKGKPAEVRASVESTVLAIGGEPHGPRFIEWNFVSSRKERIEQAKADWRAGRMKLPDLDHAEFIPLPGDPPPPASPL